MEAHFHQLAALEEVQIPELMVQLTLALVAMLLEIIQVAVAVEALAVMVVMAVAVAMVLVVVEQVLEVAVVHQVVLVLVDLAEVMATNHVVPHLAAAEQEPGLVEEFLIMVVQLPWLMLP